MPPARESLAVAGSQGQIPVGATVGGQFRIDAFVGQDAVSQTYRAIDTTHHTGAVVRIIPMRVLGAAAAQLETDIEKASALVHKNLVEILFSNNGYRVINLGIRVAPEALIRGIRELAQLRSRRDQDRDRDGNTPQVLEVHCDGIGDRVTISVFDLFTVGIGPSSG